MPVGQRSGGGIGAIAKPGAGAPSTEKVSTVAKRVLSWKAGATISVGKAVVLDSSDTFGLSVVSMTTATTGYQGLFVGIYNGEGGSGASTAVAGLIGKDALANDNVSITVAGFEEAMIQVDTVAIAIGNPLVVSTTTAGVLTSDFDITASVATTLNEAFAHRIVAWEAVTATTLASAKVFVRSGL